MTKQSKLHEGIVLRAPTPTNARITVLDAHAGKRICFTRRDTIPAGSHIGYTVTKRGVSELLDQVEILDAPLKLARDDLLFVHHVLELCDQFVPLSSPAPEIYELLLVLYRWNDVQESVSRKLLFLVKLTLMLGIHQRYPTVKPKFLEQLLTLSVDRMPLSALDLDSQKALRLWLVETIVGHVPTDQFATLSFLKELR